MDEEPNSLSLDRWLEKGGPAAASFARLWDSLWRQTRIAPEMLEHCRLTLARLHGDSRELALANDRIEATPAFAARRAAVIGDHALADEAFGAGEQAILLFAEYYWTDAQSITDAVADDVKAHHGDAGLVFLIEALGCIDGRIRAARCLRTLETQNIAKEAAHVA